MFAVDVVIRQGLAHDGAVLVHQKLEESAHMSFDQRARAIAMCVGGQKRVIRFVFTGSPVDETSFKVLLGMKLYETRRAVSFAKAVKDEDERNCLMDVVTGGSRRPAMAAVAAVAAAAAAAVEDSDDEDDFYSAVAVPADVEMVDASAADVERANTLMALRYRVYLSQVLATTLELGQSPVGFHAALCILHLHHHQMYVALTYSCVCACVCLCVITA